MLFVCLHQSSAKRFNALIESPRVISMGQTSTFLEGPLNLYYNPALLAENEKLFIALFNPLLEVSNIVKEFYNFTSFPEEMSDVIEKFFNYPLYLAMGISPIIKIKHTGFSFFAKSQMSVLIRNTVHHDMRIDYKNDKGFIFGQAMKFKDHFHIGASIKYIVRESLSKNFDIFSPKVSDIITFKKPKTAAYLRDILGTSKGAGFGFDLGFLYKYSQKNSEFKIDLSILDVTNTSFKRLSGENNIPDQKIFIKSGLSWKQNFLLFHYILSLGFMPLNSSMTFKRKLHAGLELEFPFISLLGGYSEGYLSYGVEMKLWPIKILAGLHGIEIGSSYRQQEERRVFIYLYLFDFYF